jgi:2-oxoglutarate ferredoxin oxidoreductase subunit alpha
MTDLDLGMNDNMSPPLKWDDQRDYNRGKVLDAEALEKLERFGRYLDVDGDGITYRTIPGTHPTKGSFFTRGTSRDEYAAYTEEGPAYVRNMERLARKWESAKNYVPGPELYQKEKKSEFGMLFFGTTTWSALEARDMLEAEGITLDAMRVKSFPFNDEVRNFVDSHDRVFVIEQNRDAQLKTLLVNEIGIDPGQLVPVLNFDGFPITADLIKQKIFKNLVGKLKTPYKAAHVAPGDSQVEE